MDATIASLEQSFGPDHTELADDLWTRGHVSRLVGRWSQCEEDLARMTELQRRSGASPAAIAAARAERMLCALERGSASAESLVPELRRELSILQAGSDRSLEALGRLALGRALVLGGLETEAEAELLRARELLVADPRDHARDIGRIDGWLAQR